MFEKNVTFQSFPHKKNKENSGEVWSAERTVNQIYKHTGICSIHFLGYMVQQQISPFQHCLDPF